MASLLTSVFSLLHRVSPSTSDILNRERYCKPTANKQRFPRIQLAAMTTLLPVAVYGLEVLPGDVLTPATPEFPATVRSIPSHVDYNPTAKYQSLHH